MTPFDVAVWLWHVAVLVLAWPWLRQPGQPGRLIFWFSLLLPIISWTWLVPKGVNLRLDQRDAKQKGRREGERRQAVSFLRQQLVTGTPVEQENARQVLAMWGVPEQAPPIEEVTPAIVVTDRPEQVRHVGDWLVVGGVARAHIEPPSLGLYKQGCRCPGCVALVRDVALAKASHQRGDMGGFAEAITAARRQVAANLSVPPALGAWSSTADCPDCDVEEMHVRNGAAQVCVVYLTGSTCPAHGSADVNLAIPIAPR